MYNLTLIYAYKNDFAVKLSGLTLLSQLFIVIDLLTVFLLPVPRSNALCDSKY